MPQLTHWYMATVGESLESYHMDLLLQSPMVTLIGGIRFPQLSEYVHYVHKYNLTLILIGTDFSKFCN